MAALDLEIINKSVRCGFNTCDLATHYCEPVQQECVQCLGICHNGAEIHEEECQERCSIYLQNLKIQERLRELAQTTAQPIIDVTTEVMTGQSTEIENTTAWFMWSWIIGTGAFIVLIIILVLLGFWCVRRKRIPGQRPQRDLEKADGMARAAGQEQDEQEDRMEDVCGGAGSTAPLLGPAEGVPVPEDIAERLPGGTPQEAAGPSDDGAAGTSNPGDVDEKQPQNFPERGKTEGGRVIHHPSDANNATTARAEDDAPHPVAHPQTMNPAQQVPPSTTETEETVDPTDLPEEGQPGRIRRWVHGCPSVVSTVPSIHRPAASLRPGQPPSFQPESSLNLQSDDSASYFSDSVSRAPSVIQRPREHERLPSGSG